jgi:hypothetical protein
MAVDYTNYRPDLSGIYPNAGTGDDVTTGRYGGTSPDYNRRISRVRTYFKKPRNYSKLAGLGYVLPNIGGLRLKDINTAQGRRTAIMGGPGNLVYGLAGPNARKGMMVGRDAKGRIALVRRTPKPPSPGAGAPGAGGPQLPKTDEYTKYEKDYPWVANYLRSLRDEGSAFETKYKNEFLPNVTNALNAYANLGTQTSDRYARAAATSVAANQAAANIAPTEAAGATGAFDPIALAASQAASRAMGEASAENARFAATQSALAPASAAQGLLAGIQRGYSSISSEYSRKRLEDQMKIEQWIDEQKSSALDRQVQQQYNLGMLNLQQGKLDLDILSEKNDAAREGQFTGAELIDKGFRPVPPKAGPKSMAKVQAAGIVTATDGGRYYKPGGSGSGGKGGSGNGLTANQQQQLGKQLLEVYQGTTRDVAGNVTGQGPGYRDLPVQQQIAKIETWVRQEVERGNIPRNRAAIASFVAAAIPFLQTNVGGIYKSAPQGNTTTWGNRIAARIVGG